MISGRVAAHARVDGRGPLELALYEISEGPPDLSPR